MSLTRTFKIASLGLSHRTLSSSVAMSTAAKHTFETLRVGMPRENVAQVELNRPEKKNAINQSMWLEIGQCFNALATDSDVRAIVLSGAGKLFTGGLDLTESASLMGFIGTGTDVGRKAFFLRQTIRLFQESFTAIEKCPKPVIAAVHHACIGGGVDLITSCDIRYCSQDAFFQIKEVDIGLTADIGTLQRLPKIVGNDSLVRELAYTARTFYSTEAQQIGMISRVFNDKAALLEGALNLASLIATKSPVAVQGTKVNLVYSRDHGVEDGLHFGLIWNQGMLQSEDVVKAGTAFFEKKSPTFSKL